MDLNTQPVCPSEEKTINLRIHKHPKPPKPPTNEFAKINKPIDSLLK